MSKPDHLTYQQRCMVRALMHSGLALACAGNGDASASELHIQAAKKWADTAVAAQDAVNRAANKWLVQQMLDASWVEPIDVAEDAEPN